MKHKWIFIVFGIIWICLTVGICFAIYYTKNPKCLLAYLIPAFISIKVGGNGNNDENEEVDDSN